MTWILTHTGVRFDLLQPAAHMVDLRDIAVALSRIPRFTGHTMTPWSVADHSLLVASLVAPEHRLAALLHDAQEAYVGDASSPLKLAMRELCAISSAAESPYDEIERNVWLAICAKFGMAWGLPNEVRRADALALEIERQRLMPDCAAWTVPQDIAFDAAAYRPPLWSDSPAKTAIRFERSVVSMLQWVPA